MEFAQRLKSIRQERKLSIQELASLVGVSVVAIRHWENGTRKPSCDVLAELSKALLVSSDALLGIPRSNDLIRVTQEERRLLSDYRALDEFGKRAVLSICSIELDRTGNSVFARPKHPISKRTRMIPHFATPSAAGINTPFEVDGYDIVPISVLDNVPDGADFAVNIQGNSMFPYINDGDVVFVKQDEDISVGDIGIFCVDGAMYCKQYYVDKDGNLLLVSANPELKNSNIFVSADSSNSVKCCGRVLLDQKAPLPKYISNNDA